MDGKDFLCYQIRIQMENNNQLQIQEKTLLTFLAQGITKDGKIDTNGVDRVGMNMCLKKYKQDNGYPNFGELFKIPSKDRIGEMAKTDMRGAVISVAVILTLTNEALNLSRGMNAVQIVDLAEAIVDDADTDDKISMEDLMIFCQRLVRGHYGTFYESMDSAKFMTFFNKYRDERWEEGIRLRDEKHEEYKKLGDSNDYNRNYVRDASPFGQYMEHLRNKTQARKDEAYENQYSDKRDRE